MRGQKRTQTAKSENLRLLERLVEKKDYGTSKKASFCKNKITKHACGKLYELC